MSLVSIEIIGHNIITTLEFDYSNQWRMGHLKSLYIIILKRNTNRFRLYGELDHLSVFAGVQNFYIPCHFVDTILGCFGGLEINTTLRYKEERLPDVIMVAIREVSMQESLP